MPDSPWFTAELRDDDGGARVGLRRRGSPETGNPKIDAYRDRGGVYVITIEDAVALRDSLTAALERVAEMRRPPCEGCKAPSTCTDSMEIPLCDACYGALPVDGGVP